jgi:hypothetical protein
LWFGGPAGAAPDQPTEADVADGRAARGFLGVGFDLSAGAGAAGTSTSSHDDKDAIGQSGPACYSLLMLCAFHTGVNLDTLYPAVFTSPLEEKKRMKWLVFYILY